VKSKKRKVKMESGKWKVEEEAGRKNTKARIEGLSAHAIDEQETQAVLWFVDRPFWF
jgi:hypothetical protein